MRFAAIKIEEQLDLQALHRMRDALGDGAYRCTEPDPQFSPGT